MNFDQLMAKSSPAPQLHPANDVITKLYSAVMDNNNFPELFAAWDEFVDEIFQVDPEEARLWKSLLNEHFDQAGKLMFVNKPSLAEEKQTFVDKQPFPAILFNAKFRVVTKNQQADQIWSQDLDSDILSALLPPFDPKRIISLEYRGPDRVDPVLVSLNIGVDSQPHVVMAVIHSVEFPSGDGASAEKLYVLRIATPRWYAELGRMLANTYGLTEAELEVAKGLYQNQNLNSIAEERCRSIRTVRTQLSHIFEKTGASSQAELIGMISNLGQILEAGRSSNELETSTPRFTSSPQDVKTMTCTSAEGHTLSFVTFGDPKGKPVLSLQPTIPPEMNERFRRAAVEAGIRFITPFKPGSGQSSSRSYLYSPKIATADYQTILDALGIVSVDVLGICSGGIYALEFAKSYPKSVKTVTLGDTGVPLKGRKEFGSMSATSRRTFLAARYFPNILLTPHRMIAKEFHSSAAGEKKIVEYFFSGSKSDLDLVRNQQEYYSITKAIIGYSFEDVKQLVDCVCLWASDWSDVLNTVANDKEITFVHGRLNDLFSCEAIEQRIKTYPNSKLKPIEGCSQLGIFIHPEILMKALVN